VKIASAKVHHSLKEVRQMLENCAEQDSERRGEKILDVNWITSKEIAQNILNNELEPKLILLALKFLYKEMRDLTEEELIYKNSSEIQNACDWWLIIKEHWCNVGVEEQYRKDYLIKSSQYMQANIFCLPFLGKKDINKIMDTLKIAGLDILLSGFEFSNHTREYTKSDEFIQDWIKHIKEMHGRRKNMIADTLQPLGIIFPRTTNSETFLKFEKYPFLLMKKLTGLLGLKWDKRGFKRRTPQNHHRLTTEIYPPRSNKTKTEHTRKPGVYRITCTKTGDSYIGSSSDIPKRWVGHKGVLNAPNSLHHNDKLQELWEEFGKECFYFEVLEETEDYKIREVELIRELKPTLNSTHNGKQINVPHELWERICRLSQRLNNDNPPSKIQTREVALEAIEKGLSELERENKLI
jgi:hypothetical protein